MDLTGNVILITGGTSGIGRALAEQFHRLGNQVIVTGRRRALLDELAGTHPGLRAYCLDQTRPDAVTAFAAQLAEEVPGLNVLIHNAGISRLEDLTAPAGFADARAIIETNIASVLQLTALLLPGLCRQPQASLLTVTSELAFVPLAAYPTYCASKAFLHSWVQSLRHQLRRQPVEVLELAPPYVQTALTGPDHADDPAAMPLDQFIAEVMARLAAGDHPDGEIIIERSREKRFAERDGHYRAVFSRFNPP